MKKPEINQMTLREKIGQTLMVRQSDLMMRADKAYDELRDPGEAKELLEKYQFGAIWVHGNQDVNGMSPRFNDYFQFTSKSYLEWLNDVTSGLKIPPICANDPEGELCTVDLSTYPIGPIVGAANSEELAYELGRCVALEHKSLGCEWLWNPGVDLVNRFTVGVAKRFANTQDRLIRMQVAYQKGIHSAGVATSALHFPGADDKETRDSHVVTTMIGTPFEEWKRCQGAIFQALIDNGVDTVMSAAKMYPEVESTKVRNRYLPAGLSKKMLIDLLKGEMGFEGVVITDDVNMGGFTSYYDHDELYGRMLEAGNDVLLGVGLDAVDIVEDCVKRGIVTEERITDACRRVLNLKEKLGLFRDDYARGTVRIEDVAPKTKEVSRKIADAGITLIRDNIGLLPVKKPINHVTIFTYSHTSSTFEKLQAMKCAFEKRGASVVLKRRPESFAEVEEAARVSDLIIYAGYIGFFAPKGAPSFYDEEFWALRYAFTAGAEKSIGISLGYPFIHYMFMGDADVFVNLYSPDSQVQESFVDAVYGDIEFKGTSPVDLSGT